MLLQMLAALRNAWLLRTIPDKVVRFLVACRTARAGIDRVRSRLAKLGQEHARGDRLRCAGGKLCEAVDRTHGEKLGDPPARAQVHARLLPAAGAPSSRPAAPMCSDIKDMAGLVRPRAVTADGQGLEGRGRAAGVALHSTTPAASPHRYWRPSTRGSRASTGDRSHERIESQAKPGPLVEGAATGGGRATRRSIPQRCG